jgi:Flp pilus assembly protein TadD
MHRAVDLAKKLACGIAFLGLAGCFGSSKGPQPANVPPADPPLATLEGVDIVESSLKLGDAAYMKRDYATAAHFYFRAHQLKPSDEVAVKLGYALFKSGNHADAEQVLGAVLERQPKNADALRGLAHSRLAQGRIDDAVALYKRAIAEGGQNDPRLWSGLGAAHDLAGRHAAAREAYAAGLKAQRDHVGIRQNLALSYALTGEYEKASSILMTLAEDPVAAGFAKDALAAIETMKKDGKIRPAPTAAREPAAKEATKEAARAPERPPLPPTTAPVPPARPAKAEAAGIDGPAADPEGEIFIRTQRPRAEVKGVASLEAAAARETEGGEAAVEVAELLEQAERGPRYIWEEKRKAPAPQPPLP